MVGIYWYIPSLLLKRHILFLCAKSKVLPVGRESVVTAVPTRTMSFISPIPWGIPALVTPWPMPTPLAMSHRCI